MEEELTYQRKISRPLAPNPIVPFPADFAGSPLHSLLRERFTGSKYPHTMLFSELRISPGGPQNNLVSRTFQFQSVAGL
jgi:hypothetical protein